ncbi:MAG TPA: HD domain-containing phosphohydrolase [Pyrinomonadaceae bacterium]|nr:HD domain-containing phosphohydrolase [Pyrinomonadaceae bacterium]
MSQERADVNSRAFSWAVIIAGILLWAISTASILLAHALREQLTILALVPLIVVTGMFPNTFPLPASLRSTQEKITFTLSDAIVLFIACWLGIVPAIFIAGIEGFTSSRRTIRRLTSNLFSFGMMSMVAAASSVALDAVLRYGFAQAGAGGRGHTFSAVVVALLVANIVHIIINTGFISTFFALRHGSPVLKHWRETFLWAAPLFLPTSTVASLLYFSLQYDVLIMFVIGAPILVAIYFGHRRYRVSVDERIGVMEKAHRETIEALAVTINAKDEVTHDHVMRVQIYAAGVARLLGCSQAEIEALKAGALLHDIGKIAVPDYILNKPGKLTAAEFEKMKTHTIVGAQILGRVEFPYPIVPVVRHHHERWDGNGYPDGLKAEQIPLTARILSVVDCFDAVREDRQYRKAMTREEALDFIMGGSGTMYDPRVVGTFITHLPEFEAQILAERNSPAPTYGITPLEELSEAARRVLPAAGLAESDTEEKSGPAEFSLKELRALYDLAQSVNAARGSDATLKAFTEKLQAFIRYETCAITLVSPDGDENVVAHAAGQHADLLMGRKVKIGEGVTGWALANHRPFSNTDPKLDVPAELALTFADYRTLVVFPLIKETEIYGAVTLYSSTLSEYDADHRRLLAEASALLAAALSTTGENAALTKKSQLIADDQPTPAEPIFKNSTLKPANEILESDLAH